MTVKNAIPRLVYISKKLRYTFFFWHFFYPKNELSIKRFYKYLPFVLYRQLPDHAQEIHDKELTRTTMFSAFFFLIKTNYFTNAVFIIPANNLLKKLAL